MDELTIGQRVRELRKKKNMTQDDLAGLMNASRVQVNQWESGARELSSSRIILLADIFETTCDYLMRGIVQETQDVKLDISLGEPVHQKDPDITPKHTDASFCNSELGLSIHSVDALRDVMLMEGHKREQYLAIVNGLLGAKNFWRLLMPAAAAAFTIKEQSALGGTVASAPRAFSDEAEEAIQKSVDVLKFGNSAGYMNHLLIAKEKAFEFQISEATTAFYHLLKSFIEKNACPMDKNLENWTEPYHRNSSENTSVNEFMKFLSQFGLDETDLKRKL